MPENQKKTPCSKLPKRNPDSKPYPPTNPERPEMAANGREIEISEPNSDTTPASDGQTQRPDMAANDRGIEISELNSDTTPTSDGQTQRPEMSANDREIEISELTFRQQAALPTIAHARSLAQAARDTGVAERTLRRWLEDPSFRQELDRLRQKSYDLARQQAQAAMPMCLSILADAALESPDPALRLRAALPALLRREVRRGRQPQGAPQCSGRRLPFCKDRLPLGIASIFGTLSARMIAFQFRWFARLRSVIPAFAGMTG